MRVIAVLDDSGWTLAQQWVFHADDSVESCVAFTCLSMLCACRIWTALPSVPEITSCRSQKGS